MRSMRHATHGLAVAVLVAVATVVATAAAADEAGRGFYFGADLGVSVARSLESTRTNVGIPTNCDQWLDPIVIGGEQLPLPAERCQPRNLPSSASEFDLGAGVLAGVHIGYTGLGPIRIEAEYFHRWQGGEKVSLFVPGDPKQREFSVRDEEIGGLRADNFFANLYYDFPDLGASAFTPYVGVGVGASRVEMDYSATSIRRGEEALRALDPPRHSGAANKVSHASETLSDWLWGYQLMAGLDYALTERRLLTAKFRYGSALGDFRDDGNAWRSLRGHASTVAPGGAPVHYGISAPLLSFWAVSLGLKFFF